jgi:membrane protein YqaA with SNARE-associated domain
MPAAEDAPPGLRRRLVNGLLRVLAATTNSRWYAPLAGLIAFGLTLTASAPYAAVLVAALWLTPERWKSLAFFSALGGACGALALMMGLRHVGWAAIHASFPELAASPVWLQVTQALQDYGVAVLCIVAAAPMPQTPALALAAGADLNLPAAFVALFIGRLIKYGTLGWLVATGSPWLDRLSRAKRPRS